jgi:NADH-quinone oxidoreductase subunit A
MVQAGLDEFLFVFVFFLVGLVLPLSMVIINYVLGPRTRGERRLASYESGMPPIGTAWMQFGASYYIFCLIFLAFDVDVLYLFPVLIAYQKSTGAFELLELFIFLLLIGRASAYAWRKGAFKWR